MCTPIGDRRSVVLIEGLKIIFEGNYLPSLKRANKTLLDFKGRSR